MVVWLREVTVHKGKGFAMTAKPFGGRRTGVATMLLTTALLILTPTMSSAGTVLTKLPAAEKPEKPTESAGNRIELKFPVLGLGSSYTFAGSGSAVDLSVPIPTGHTPKVLRAKLVVPTNFGEGTLTLESGDVFVAAFTLPKNSSKQQIVPLELPLSSAVMSDGFEKLTLRLDQGNSGGALRSQTCSTTLPLRMINPSIVFTGETVPPKTIADFFPPLLREVVLYVPDRPSLAVQTATTAIAADLVAAYGPVPVAVSVRRSGDVAPPTSDGLRRAVAIQEGGTKGLSVSDDPSVGPLLVVRGTSATLPVQASLLGSKISKIVQSAQASVVRPISGPQAGQASQTFSQLGLSGGLTFAGVQTLGLPIDSTLLGGAASSLRIHLEARYSPVESDAVSSVSAGVNGVVLATRKLGSSGHLKFDLTVPKELMGRSTGLELTVSYFPRGFICSGIFRTMTFTVDPRSVVKPEFVLGGVGGFQSLPQALMPTFQLALESRSVRRLAEAVAVIRRVQSVSRVPVRPSAVTLKTALSSGQPALIVAASRKLGALDPPLAYRKNRTFTVDSGKQGAFTMGSDVGSLQVFDDTPRARTVVLATATGSFRELDQIFSWLGRDSKKWQELSGDVLAQGDSGSPQTFAIRAGGPQVFVPTTDRKYLYLGIGAAFLFGLLLVAAYGLSRWRRSRAVD